MINKDKYYSHLNELLNNLFFTTYERRGTNNMIDLYEYLIKEEGYNPSSQIHILINNKELIIPIKNLKKCVYGNWIRYKYECGKVHPYKATCSICGYVSTMRPFPPKFCPECGSKNSAV